ncbi:MAG: NTP transferase domain-containing protein [Clostridiales bacterium]|nr:NTP transferase domain-containing protein [Clostridiales bacterium]
MEAYGIIMAGGGGTRFWPLSRKDTPKQLLNLDGKEIMINETIDRLAQVVNKDKIFIVTNKSQVGKMKEVVAGRIEGDNILSEPAARNTAACIGYAAVKILKTYGDGVMVVTPSDAYIKDESKYADILNIAIATAKRTDKLVTVGIKPTFAATGYGYIRYNKSEDNVKEVKNFVEKPDLETAKKYFKSEEYVWNSGIFVWKASVILEKFKSFLPDIYKDLTKLYDAICTSDEIEVIEDIYPKIRPISIDYGVMEKAGDILVVPGEFGWNDVGSWDMLNALHEADESGNISIGDALAMDSKNTTIYSSNRLVVGVGLEDLIVVETPTAVLVCPKDKAQDVKKVVDVLIEQKRSDLI